MKSTKPSICIFGPGVVGYATGIAFQEKGFKVGFIGRNAEKAEKLRKEGFWSYTFESFPDHSFEFDISFLTIATPTKDGKIQLDGIKEVAKYLGNLLQYTKNYHVVVVKSTVTPGTTEELIIPILEKMSGKKAGRDFGVCMAPEYLREVSAVDDSRKPWAVLIGQLDKKSGNVLEAAFKPFKAPIFKCAIKEAEMQKYIHNLFNAVKITFFNEMRQLAKNIGADADTIFKMTALSCEGIWNPMYGLRDMGPFTGSCLPKDTKALYAWAKKNGYAADLLGMTIQVNNKILEKMGMEEGKMLGTRL